MARINTTLIKSSLKYARGFNDDSGIYFNLGNSNRDELKIYIKPLVKILRGSNEKLPKDWRKTKSGNLVTPMFKASISKQVIGEDTPLKDTFETLFITINDSKKIVLHLGVIEKFNELKDQDETIVGSEAKKGIKYRIVNTDKLLNTFCEKNLFVVNGKAYVITVSGSDVKIYSAVSRRWLKRIYKNGKSYYVIPVFNHGKLIKFKKYDFDVLKKIYEKFDKPSFLTRIKKLVKRNK